MAVSEQLSAEVTYEDGTTEDVTTSASWSSSDEGVATVSSGGLVTAVAAGAATITASYKGVSGECAVTVEPAAESLSVTPSSVTLDSPGGDGS